VGKAPAFQFYASDFISDENVVLMNNQEVGCYIKLLCFCWKQGSIPNDIDKIGKLCGENSSVMAQLWESIKPCFKENGHGRLVNPRLEKEREKQKAFRKERSESGKKGAAKRWKDKDLDSSATTEPMANDSSSSSSSSSSSKPIDTPNGVLSPDASGDGPDPPKIPQCPQGEIKALYHEILCPPLAPVNEWSPELAKILRTMWREKPERWELPWWKKYFRFVKASDFLMGKKTDFIADLEWIIRPRNRTKILNGRFHNRGSPELKKFAGILEWLRVQEEKA
jgi:uncharacterized protein YdaU (DUF1376 family)